MSAQKPSLVTCCPDCAATFYVTSEQLSAHGGDVRCGKCSHMFNALNHLSELPDESVEEASVKYRQALDEAHPEEIIVEEVSYPAAEDQDEAVASGSESETHPEEDSPDSPPAVIDPPPYSAAPAPSAPITAGPKITWDLASKNKLKRPGKRKIHIGVFIGLALVLAMLAAAQATYYMRSQIASQWPVLKPPLVSACNVLGCTVELPKVLELLTIDDSDLQEDADHIGLIHLSSTIINSAAFTQAYPLLEVTLTNKYDKPILRRTFTPAEYLPLGTNISRGMAPHAEIRITVGLSASGEPVAGYRVLVTYS